MAIRPFRPAIKGLDPPAEGFEPVQVDHPAVRVYLLKGRHTWIAWCRDKASNWKTELAAGKAPAPLRGLALDLTATRPAEQYGWRCRVYDPWTDRWSTAGAEERPRVTSRIHPVGRGRAGAMTVPAQRGCRRKELFTCPNRLFALALAAAGVASAWGVLPGARKIPASSPAARRLAFDGVDGPEGLDDHRRRDD